MDPQTQRRVFCSWQFGLKPLEISCSKFNVSSVEMNRFSHAVTQLSSFRGEWHHEWQRHRGTDSPLHHEKWRWALFSSVCSHVHFQVDQCVSMGDCYPKSSTWFCSHWNGQLGLWVEPGSGPHVLKPSGGQQWSSDGCTSDASVFFQSLSEWFMTIRASLFF